MDAAIRLNPAVQSAKPAQAAQPNAAKTEENGSSTEFQDLLAQCGKTQSEAAGQTEDSKQQEGTEQVAEQPDGGKEGVEDSLIAGQIAAMMQLAFVDLAQSSQPVVENPQEMVLTLGEPVEQIQPAGGVETVDAALAPKEQSQSGPAGVPVEAAPETVVSPEQTVRQQTGMNNAAPDAAGPQIQQPQMQVQEQAQEQAQEQTQPQTQQQAKQTPDGDSMQAEVVSNVWHSPLFGEKVEQAPVRVGDSPVEMTQPAEQVQRQLSSRLESALDRGADQLVIQLEPEDLGKVVAEFTHSPEGVLHVVLHAESEQTARLLQEHAPSLGLLMQENTRTEVQIQVTQPQQEQTAWQQDGRNADHQQQQQQRRRDPDQRESEAFLHQLRLGLVQQSVSSV